MSKLTRDTLILLILFLFSLTNNIISSGPAAGSSSPLPKRTDEMLQFTAGGHVLGFRKGEMVIASGDHALRIEFVNARPVSPAEEIKSPEPRKNRDAAQPLGKVSYRDLWAGVTLVYEKNSSGVVKSSYLVEPGSALSGVDLIRLRYNVPVKVDGNDDLVLSFAAGDMRETRPVVWQEIEGERVPVEVAYRLIGNQEVGFRTGSCDPRYPLVIDPVLSWDTFLGGSEEDYGYGIAVDTSGNVYVVGTSQTTWGSPIRPFTGPNDAFVAKLNGSGILQWNTFLGSSSNDEGRTIAVDATGNVYVAGSSTSTWGTPVRSFTGLWDAFAAKLNGNGVLQWHTFLGSPGSDLGFGIGVDTSGSVYVAGYSDATWGLPISPIHMGTDAFVAKLSGSGALQWNTFLGFDNASIDGESGRAIAVDESGNVFVAVSGWDNTYMPANSFVARLNGSGVVKWSTYLLGGLSAIAVDTSGSVYVAGYSYATWGSPLRPYTGGSDAFVAKLNGSGTLQWNTFLGGSADDSGNAIAVNKNGNICVTGNSGATWGWPVYPFAGPDDAFAAKLSASGALQWNAFLGSSGGDGGDGMAVDKSGNIYIVGTSGATWGWPIRFHSGSWDAFVAKISSSLTKNDFNGDGQEDILWRYYGSGGKNVIWYMRGAARIGSASLPAITDLNWQIVGTGDFNGDGWPDILWRYNGSGGANVVWYMKSATRTGSASLLAVTDLNWQIAGIGDFFSRDGWPDILWRYNGSGGKNVVWYMQGATRIGSASLLSVTDLNWKIGGAGDFNGDGWPDILWRYNGSGGKNVVWYMQGAIRTETATLPAVTDPNWRIENH
jgi:hypothetical protein